MTARPVKLFVSTTLKATLILACLASGTACESYRGTEPEPVGPKEPVIPEQPILKTVEILPAPLSLEQGEEIQLSVVLRDQWGAPLLVSPQVAFASTDPEIASVTKFGFVTAIAPGKVGISVFVSAGASSATAGITADVRKPVALGDVVFTTDADGWQQGFAHLKAGGTVHWKRGAATLWPVAPNTKLYLMDAAFSVVDTLDMSNGSADRTLDKPGTYRFCSGICWDPPEYGVVYVH